MAEAIRACFEVDGYSEHEDRIYLPPPDGAEIFLTKYPRDVLCMGPLLPVMPNLYVVYMIRDPRDIITSRHRAAPDRYWSGLSIWHAWVRFGRRLRRHPRVLTVRYEDFVTDPDRTQRQIAETMPFLRERASFSRYHLVARPSEDSVEALGEVRPISPVGVGHWRRHLPRVKGQIAAHGSITRDLVDFGYERDGAWLHELASVEPDTQPSRRFEVFPPELIKKERRKAYHYAARVLKRRLLGRPLPAYVT